MILVHIIFSPKQLNTDEKCQNLWARLKTRSSRKTWKSQRISFLRFSTLSFPFCTIPKTENSEMKTLECCFKPIYQTLGFPFCTIPKTENSEMKTSECSFKPFYQTPSFSNSKFSILHYTQNGKLGVGNFGVFSEVYQNSDFFNYLIKLRGFPTPSFPFCTTLKTENSEMENFRV